MCGLEAYADAIVDSLGVEHRKRTTIAVELAAKVGRKPLGVKLYSSTIAQTSTLLG